MLDKNERFVIENYGKKSTFSSFLPGISGRYGIPIWCYYVNRGQCITSFGIEDKDHAIMEFFPAHQAYQNTKKIGFRTFLKKNGKYIEPFQDETKAKKMLIGMNELEIIEEDSENNLEIKVTYFTLPSERVGGLVRKVSVKNTSSKTIAFEILDGMPALVPFGVNMNSMKEMGQTCKAWMQVEDVETKVPYFRVRVSMEDTADVSKVLGGNFAVAILEDGEQLAPIVDPEVVFHYDTTLNVAEGFKGKAVDALLVEKQVTQNNLPCCFFGKSKELKTDETLTIYEMIGQVEEKSYLDILMQKCKDASYFQAKQKEAIQLTEELCKVIHTKTGSKIFDSYSKQTYLDNVLRGGYPIVLGKDKIFYLYSRKHGDIERDYNYFRMLPEFYSQGNGNFRDVNQNRRSDVLFSPYVKDANIKTFYNLGQIDGYSPLSVEKISYHIEESNRKRVLGYVKKEYQETFGKFLNSSFTPGHLVMEASKYELNNLDSIKEFLDIVINASSGDVAGEFGEGYWTDHWTYNLDLIEAYLSIYPDKEETLLFEDNTYTYFETQVKILKREDRYVKTEHGIRQYKSLDRTVKKGITHKKLRSKYGKGDVVTSNLMEKLLLLNTTKFATLDPYGMGIEMESGKPGWYDALNGLPGIFGSSMAETYELSRMIKFTIKMIEKHHQSVIVFTEVAKLMEDLYHIAKGYQESLTTEKEVIRFWEEINEVKEEYREQTLWGVSGDKIALSDSYLLSVLKLWDQVVDAGIQKAMSYEDGICPTYFTYEVTDYKEVEGKIYPKKFKVQPLPLFLEGSVRYLKLEHSKEDKVELYQNIRKSDLYDKKLSMYKVNASLKDASYEIGRTKAFTPGWLENESIWLHMEYKYLLELLRSELYHEYFDDLKKACIPFLDVDTYGRSLLENSSFLASSANPNEKIHGKGFVARLSGSTAEFINMWQFMMFGKKPFTYEDGVLRLEFEPAIPDYLVGDEKTIEAAFLGKVLVTYHLTSKKDVIPGKYTITAMELNYQNGDKKHIDGSVVIGQSTIDIRNGLVDSISVTLQND
ncbi:hypothetical protein [Anaeromicropila herbilytica]|uniref:Cellobiose phosphorylase n=1 Tax=Anaeromicropila herbilytica TaxID=2785025 RepID=A0A7R7ENP1_9FIRM|nr:hypothetical protein [Anaeromicropila herbilytica]BCN32199.1 hypothetical protein bsdtb5_34940 [Anaeromicropila herbilytica]